MKLYIYYRFVCDRFDHLFYIMMVKKIPYLLLIVLLPLVDGKAQDLELDKLPINSSYSNEIAPFYHDSVLYFSSNRRNSLFVTYFDATGDKLYHLYQVRQTPEGGWTKPRMFDARYQSSFNNASVSMNAAGNVMMISRGRGDDIRSIQTSRYGDLLGVYQVKYNGKGWGKASLLPFSKVKDHSLAHASISPDGRFLFFVSDNSSGIGKTDIYMSENVDGEWGEPTNLGKKVNTPNNELFPFYHASGKLFFASDGQGGFGGLDIFYTRQLSDGSWADPVVLDPPLNSGADDFGYYLSDDEGWGFFTTGRDGSDDIFRFKQGWPSFEVCEPQVEEGYCFTFYDEGPFKSDSVPFLYRWNFGDGHTGDGLEVDHCFNGPGNYRVTLSVVDLVQNKELMVVADYPLELVKTRQVYITCQEAVQAGKMFMCDVLQSWLPDCTGNEYFWDMGDGTRIKGESVQHVYDKVGQYTITCGTVNRQTGDKFCSSKQIEVTR